MPSSFTTPQAAVTTSDALSRSEVNLSFKAAFGGRVLALVEGCTDGVPDAQGHKADWYERKRNYLVHLSQAHDDVLLVSGADKLHNARAIVSDLSAIGEIVFERFSTKKDGTLWYYSSLSAVFKDRGVPMATAIEEVVNTLLRNAAG